MDIRFNCPACGNTIRALNSSAGRTVRCPRCKEAVRAPEEESIPVASISESSEIPMPGALPPVAPAPKPAAASAAAAPAPSAPAPSPVPTASAARPAPSPAARPAAKPAPLPPPPARPAQVVSAKPPRNHGGSSVYLAEDAEDSAEHQAATPGMIALGAPSKHIRFECNDCGAVIKAPRNLAGKKSRCPQCGERVFIPRTDAALASDELIGAIAPEESNRPLELRVDAAAAGPAPGEPLKKGKEKDGHVRFHCPGCTSPIRAPRSLLGKRSKCPHCGSRIEIIEDETAPESSDSIEIVDTGRTSAPLTFGEPAAAKGPAPDEPSRVPSKHSGGGLAGPGGFVREAPRPSAASAASGAGRSDRIRFECPKCSQVIKAPMERAGQTCSCPACGARAAVPRPANLDGDESTSIEIVDASEVLGKRPAAAAAEWAPEPDAGSSLRHPVAKEPIRFGCRECGAGIKAPVQFAGKKSRCPHCKARVIIPVRSTDTSDEPKPIELLDISEDEERKITANLSRQTRGGSLGGSSAKAGPLIDDPHDRGEGMTGSVLPDALTSASDIPLNQLLSGAPPTSQPAPPPQPASPGRPPPQAPPRPGPPRPSGAGGPTRPGQPGQPAPPARPGPRREG